MPNPSLSNSNSSTVSPFLKDSTVHIPYTNAKTFADDVFPNHVGNKEVMVKEDAWRQNRLISHAYASICIAFYHMEIVETRRGGIPNGQLVAVPAVDDVSLVDGVFDDAFSGDGEEDFVMGEGVVVLSSSLDMFTESCLGGMMLSLIFLEGLEEEAWVESMEVEEK
ncbi:hypothetical protein Tco_1001545 [Tanacetum coccineum]